MNKLSSDDRASLLRLASSLPVGDESRRAILSGLQREAAGSWEPVPGGHGGERQEKPGGGYRYRYPSKEHAEKAVAHHDEQANHHGEKAQKALAKRDYGTHNREAEKSAEHDEHMKGAQKFLKPRSKKKKEDVSNSF